MSLLEEIEDLCEQFSELPLGSTCGKMLADTILAMREDEYEAMYEQEHKDSPEEPEYKPNTPYWESVRRRKYVDYNTGFPVFEGVSKSLWLEGMTVQADGTFSYNGIDQDIDKDGKGIWEDRSFVHMRGKQQ